MAPHAPAASVVCMQNSKNTEHRRRQPDANPTASTPAVAGSATHARPRLTWGQNLITVLLATVMEAGGILDGWAHSHVPGLETVLTPWHAVLYGGYLATAGWIGLQVLRSWRHGHRGINAVPVGYGAGVVGVIGWGVAGMLDLGVWHQIFGIERGVEALLSPTHLMLAATELLIITSPLRAAWSDPSLARAPSLRAVLPAVWSAALGAQLVGFMLQYDIAFLQIVPSADPVAGINAVLVTNAILVGTMLLLLRRFQIPPGSFALLYTGIAGMLAGLIEFDSWPLIVAALVGGAVTDLLAWRLRSRPAAFATYAIVAGGSSLALWSVYLIVVASLFQFDWSVELWGGAITLAVGSSLGLALIAAPTPAVEVGQPNPTTLIPS
jgi:hypothetical protein